MSRLDNLILLCSWGREIVLEVTKQQNDPDNQLVQDVLDRGKKTPIIVGYREKILGRLRSEIWEKGAIGTSRWQVARQETSPGIEWKNLGYKQIAILLGGNHSSWVKMAGAIDNRKNDGSSTVCDMASTIG